DCACLLCDGWSRLVDWIRRRLNRAAAVVARQVVHVQPVPIDLVILRIPDEHDPEWTIVTRGWADGDAAHCRLCPRSRCSVSEYGTCVVAFPGRIEDEDCSLYAHGSPRDRGLV